MIPPGHPGPPRPPWDASRKTMTKLYHFDLKDLAGIDRRLEIWAGDVLDSGAGFADLLVISAFPGDYIPTPTSVVGGLARVGVSVAREALAKHSDWRETWQCWVSQPIQGLRNVGRLICFEHGANRQPDAVVGNVFRSVREHLDTVNTAAGTLRIPLLATGDQGFDRHIMFRRIVEQAILHLKAGLEVGVIQVFSHARSGDDVVRCAGLLVEAGLAYAETRHDWQGVEPNFRNPEFDVFCSYRHQDHVSIDALLRTMRDRRPGLRCFVDRESLNPGACWKVGILSAMARCRHSLCFITDTYPESPECMDEFHSGLLWSRVRSGYLIPVLQLTRKTMNEMPESIRRRHCVTSIEGTEALAESVLAVIGNPHFAS